MQHENSPRLSLRLPEMDASFDLAPLFQRVASVGFAAVELMLAQSATQPVDGIRALLAEHGLSISSIVLNPGSAAQLTSAQGGRRMAAFDAIVQLLDRARDVDCERVVVPLVRDRQQAGSGASLSYEDAHLATLESLKRLRFEAERRAVHLACMAGSGFLSSPIDLREFMDTVNSPWIGAYVNADPARQSVAADEWIDALGHRLRGLCLHFGPPPQNMTNMPAILADMRWRTISAALRRIHYRGDVAVATMESEELVTVFAAAQAVLRVAAGA